jgi:hypothetical protein
MLEKIGGRTRIRTLDPLIKSLVVSATFQGLDVKRTKVGYYRPFHLNSLLFGTGKLCRANRERNFKTGNLTLTGRQRSPGTKYYVRILMLQGRVLRNAPISGYDAAANVNGVGLSGHERPHVHFNLMRSGRLAPLVPSLRPQVRERPSQTLARPKRDDRAPS